MAASVSETIQSINTACQSRGGVYRQYRCQVVSWDDVSRGTTSGFLSCWGANITDTYLKSRDGTQLFTVRPSNWNEKLGRVTSGEVALVAGGCCGGGGPLQPVTLRDFLRGISQYGAYAGLAAGVDLSDAVLDERCSIRFQTTFLPVSGARGSMEFATETYNYNTLHDDDPRNIVLLCTSQGVAVQQDGSGAKRLFHHAVDEGGAVHRYWLEAERSEHKVGGEQKETATERADAVSRGKATASVIGTRAMGTRFNVLMTIQVPLQQQRHDCCDLLMTIEVPLPQKWRRRRRSCRSRAHSRRKTRSASCSRSRSRRLARSRSCSRSRCAVGRQRGQANAARVSRGSEFDVWPGLSVQRPFRHSSESVTVTVVMYNTVADGVPSEKDVFAAVDDLEELYAKCGACGERSDAAFDFANKELGAGDAAGIAAKVITQPYKPLAEPVRSHDTFPR